ncbi:MAG TPA: sugar transferase [Terriglobales bacterium]|nr:sugar transferase [Terriglobales bacterium]
MKRLFDLLIATLALVLLSPLIAIVAVLVRLRMGRPVLFRQVRPGWHECPFTVLKFRTMRQARSEEELLQPDGERLTPLGRRLRRLSLDELPQLWNVVRGDMSLVGPRPLLTEYLQRYTPEQRRRHEVRPGITGWAQVHGRQDIPFSKRLELDVWYVDHRSFALDMRILLMTFLRVFGGGGIHSGQDVVEVDDLGLHPRTRKTREGAK